MKNEGIEVARQADFVSLLVKRPRVATELAELIGVSPQTVRGWLEVYEGEGLIRKAAEKRIVRNNRTTVWEWSAIPPLGRPLSTGDPT